MKTKTTTISTGASTAASTAAESLQSQLPLPVERVIGIRPYSVPRSQQTIDLHLDGNEGIYPPRDLLDSPLALTPGSIRDYPTKSKLEGLIAAQLKLSAAQVMVTAGADDAIDRICRAFLCPGRSIVVPSPTFEMIPRFASLTGATIVNAEWSKGSFPVGEVIRASSTDTTLISVVSPNNPTGLSILPKELQTLSVALPNVYLLVDMAYDDFSDNELTQTVLRLPNAIGVRTLSKAWGLAGLRVGYAFGAEDVISALRAVSGPYPVSGPSLALATARLEAEPSDVKSFVTRIKQERKRLHAELDKLGQKPMASQANFVFSRFKNAKWVWECLAALGISVRRFAEQSGISDSLRITVPGEDAAFNRLLAALQTILKPEALLFDLDGVIADVSESYREAIIQTGAKLGITITPSDISKLKAAGNANNDWEVTYRLVTAAGKNTTLAEVTKIFEALYQGTDSAPGLCATEKLLLSNTKILETISKRYHLGIVTGRPYADAMKFLKDHNISRYFSTVVTMNDAPLKPSPAPVELAMKRLRVKRAWMFGDTPDDVHAARAANVLPIGIFSATDDNSESLLRAGAATVLKDINAIMEILP